MYKQKKAAAGQESALHTFDLFYIILNVGELLMEHKLLPKTSLQLIFF